MAVLTPLVPVASLPASMDAPTEGVLLARPVFSGTAPKKSNHILTRKAVP